MPYILVGFVVVWFTIMGIAQLVLMRAMLRLFRVLIDEYTEPSPQYRLPIVWFSSQQQEN